MLRQAVSQDLIRPIKPAGREVGSPASGTERAALEASEVSDEFVKQTRLANA